MSDKKVIGALLFRSKEPLSIKRLSSLSGEDESIVLRWIMELSKSVGDMGLAIRQVAGEFELVSDEKWADYVEQVTPVEFKTLSKSAEDTLAIIAYKQPISRQAIAKIRKKKNPDYGIRLLEEEGLITLVEEGYVTTKAFLRYVGINDIKALPPLKIEEK